ncbi:MAG: D-alanine--D-alanine ligase [Lachnospiraceae bacterium]|nr:D-alanine--D-alanine ligase [Lachnospiraceae bacterium]
MNIVVLAGGNSTEREVSLVSGREIYRALKSFKENDVIYIDVNSNYSTDVAFGTDTDWEELVFDNKLSRSESYFGENVINICKKADMVFLALHGENGEDGKIQAAFELMNIKYTGTDYKSSALAMDKALTKAVLVNKNIPTPSSFLLTKENADSNTDELVFPKVIKVTNGGSSIGVFIAYNKEDYVKYLDEAFAIEDEVLVEDYVKGREFSVGVVNGKAYPIIEIVPKEGFYDYKTKYTKGAAEDICPAVLSEEKTKEMQGLAERVCEALGIKCYARVDFLMNEDEELFCLEANTLPGMTPTSLLPQEAAVLGIDYASLCMNIINISKNK